MTNQVVYYESRMKNLRYIALACILIVGSVLCVMNGGIIQMIAGWCGLVFFGTAFLISLSRLFRHSPQLAISRAGIDDVRDGWGLIEWNDVYQISTASIHDQRFIILSVRDSESIFAALTSSKDGWRTQIVHYWIRRLS